MSKQIVVQERVYEGDVVVHKADEPCPADNGPTLGEVLVVAGVVVAGALILDALGSDQ